MAEDSKVVYEGNSPDQVRLLAALFVVVYTNKHEQTESRE